MLSPRTAATVLLLASPVALSGCLQRTLKVTTEPPGALVWLNDVEVGTTPLETDFTYYGGYDVRIRREGFEPITEKRKLKAPVHEWPVIDLVAEAIPAKFHNRVEWHYSLTPAWESRPDQSAAEQELIDRARELESRLQRQE